MKGFFITGTGTDVGKTYISALLMRAFSKMGPATYFKPVQTGCARDEAGELGAPDFEYLLKNGLVQTAPYEVHVPYRFEPACSPHLAARLANQTISLDHCNECLQILGRDNMVVLAEGAGGVAVPLGKDVYMYDCMRAFGLPAILVTTPDLGTLNHTLLSFSVLLQKGIRVAGIIVNNSKNNNENYIYRENISFLKEYFNPIPMLEVKFGAQNNDATESYCNDLGQKI
ncbi:MAG: dethiobiotin synthase [Chitinivibrionales bacterium]|nr:dethiobiotin synthase [Chitinivibrionales bacterium]